jgi:endonuclease/exonuclease/phosphatase (EEP) superfamily protein YafD
LRSDRPNHQSLKSCNKIWWIALINYVGIYWFIPLPILIAFALRLRYWRLLLGLAIPTLTFLGLYGAFFLPSFRQGQGTLTVMSFNVWDSNSDEQAIGRSQQPFNPIAAAQITCQLLPNSCFVKSLY